MNEQELRAMIRESISRHLGAREDIFTTTAAPGSARLQGDLAAHAAFVRLPVMRGGDDDGACLIEPAVRCNHCGYCQSYGH